MSKVAKSLRIFCAVELPANVRARVVDHIAQLRAAAPMARVSWAREEGLHVTLKFLGEIDSNHLPAITRAAERAVQAIQPCSLVLETTGTFPSQGTPRVLWLGVTDPSGNLSKLYDSLEAECEGMGFSREVRAFHPHLTIARQRAPQGAQTPAALNRESQFQPAEFPVTELLVMRSELGAGGSRYTTMSRHALPV